MPLHAVDGSTQALAYACLALSLLVPVVSWHGLPRPAAIYDGIAQGLEHTPRVSRRTPFTLQQQADQRITGALLAGACVFPAGNVVVTNGCCHFKEDMSKSYLPAPMAAAAAAEVPCHISAPLPRLQPMHQRRRLQAAAKPDRHRFLAQAF